MGGTLSKTKKVDFLNGPSYWKWCVWDGQCFGSFEVKLHVNILLNFEMILARYQLTCPHLSFSFRTRPATAALPGWCKADSSQGCCGSSPRGLVLLGENCGVIRVHPTGRLFFSRVQLIQFVAFSNQNRPQTNQVGYVSSMDLFLVLSGWSSKWKPCGPFSCREC